MDTVPSTALWSLAVTEGSISGSAAGAGSSAAGGAVGAAVGMAVGAAVGAVAGAGLQAANTRAAGSVHASVFCFTLMALSSSWFVHNQRSCRSEEHTSELQS